MPSTPLESPHLDPPRRKLTLRSVARWLLITLASLWLLAALTLVALRFLDPPTTAVHAERRIQSWFSTKPYTASYDFVPLNRISPDFQHAVIAAEGDLDDHKPNHRLRGGSTIDQQLVKNLFFGTGRTLLRKGAETTLVPIAELVLGKQRILELYLNVVEWGPGIYGAEAASRYYFHTSARNLNRRQAAELAAILPAPLKRRPDHMTRYSTLIQERMSQMNW